MKRRSIQSTTTPPNYTNVTEPFSIEWLQWREYIRQINYEYLNEPIVAECVEEIE